MFDFLSDHAHDTEKKIVASGEDVEVWKERVKSDPELSADERLWMMRTIHYHLNEYSEVRGVLASLSVCENEVMRTFAVAELTALNSMGEALEFAPLMAQTEAMYVGLAEFASGLDKSSLLKDWVELTLASMAVLLAICHSKPLADEDILARVKHLREVFGSSNGEMTMTLDLLERKLER